MSFRNGAAAALAVVLLSPPAAAAQSRGLTVDVRTAAVADSVPSAPGTGNSGVFLESQAMYQHVRPRTSWTFGGVSHLRNGISADPVRLDQHAASAAFETRWSRATTIHAAARVQYSPRFSLGVASPDGASPDGLALDLPGMHNVTTAAEMRVTRVDSRRRTSHLEYAVERLVFSDGSRTSMTHRLGADTTYRLTPHSAVVIRPVLTARASRLAEGASANTTLETSVAFQYQVSPNTSVTAAAIPTWFARRDGAAPASTVQAGGAVEVDHAWSPRWRSTLALRQAIMSGEGYAEPEYARSISTGLAAEFSRVSLGASATRVASGQRAGATAPSGNVALTVSLRSRLSRAAAFTLDYQQTSIGRAPSGLALPAERLRGRKLSAAVAVAIRRR